VSAAIERLSSIARVDPERVAVCGHSAGGQLALWAAGERGLKVRAAVSLAGVLDLEDAAARGLGGGAVQSFLGGTPEEVPERYAQASPAARLPLGVPHLVVHGSRDTTVPPEMSERYCESAVAAGDTVRYLQLRGMGHKEVATGRGPAFSAVAQFLEEAFS
jgi:dipeptidyl aminopeptidase/acylaminoacyl peptidase